MPEPISSSTATATVATVTLVSLMAGLQASVVLGSFAGAVVFVVTADDLGHFKKVALFAASIIAGVLADGLAGSVLSFMLPEQIVIAPGVGALVASAVTVKLLQAVIRADSDTLLNLIRRGKT